MSLIIYIFLTLASKKTEIYFIEKENEDSIYHMISKPCFEYIFRLYHSDSTWNSPVQPNICIYHRYSIDLLEQNIHQDQTAL